MSNELNPPQDPPEACSPSFCPSGNTGPATIIAGLVIFALLIAVGVLSKPDTNETEKVVYAWTPDGG